MVRSFRYVLAGALLGTVQPALAAAQSTASCRLAGRYAMSVQVGARAAPGTLDLVCHDQRLWGRLAVVFGDTLFGAAREFALRGDTIHLQMGGGLEGLDVVGAGDALTGRLHAGRSFGFSARRTAEAPAWLTEHGALRPWDGLAAPVDSGHSYPVMLDDGELVFTRHGRRLTRQTLMLATRTPSGWTAAPLLPPDSVASDRGPSPAPDGRSLLFASTRRLPSDTATRPPFRLWTVARRGRRWDMPRPAHEGPATLGAQQPSQTRDGWLYFAAERSGGLGGRDVYRVRRAAAADTAERIGPPVSGRADEHGAWVSPEGDLMIVSSSRTGSGGAGGDDLYLLRRSSSGWSDAEPLPVPINSFGNEYGAWLAPDRRTLWFTSDRFGIAAIYRVDLQQYGIILPRP